jgi:hypothetical protein
MLTLIAFFIFFLALFVASVGWIIRALVALFRRERRPGLFWGVPVAVIVAIFAAKELLLWVVGFGVAYFNGGSGRS